MDGQADEKAREGEGCLRKELEFVRTVGLQKRRTDADNFSGPGSINEGPALNQIGICGLLGTKILAPYFWITGNTLHSDSKIFPEFHRAGSNSCYSGEEGMQRLERSSQETIVQP